MKIPIHRFHIIIVAYAKCIAVLCKIYRMGKITETEFYFVKDKLKSRFLIVDDSGEAA